MPFIDRKDPTPYYIQVYEQIAKGIENGVYASGNKLPSIRQCAIELGVSNTTVELAYQRLSEEGYVVARRGSGYRICHVGTPNASREDSYPEQFASELKALMTHEANRNASQNLDYDFCYDSADRTLFPVAAWARVCREVFFEKGVEAACLYNDRQGLKELRIQIANYLQSERGINVVPELILIMPTTRGIVSEVLSLFDPRDTVVGMEEPGYNEVFEYLAHSGFKVENISVYPTPDAKSIEASISGVDVLFTTPASQFPSNVSMPSDVRSMLVNWAQQNETYIIADEYGWEFATGSSRIPPLAALDNMGRIITLGTFSNLFSPAVCLSYAVLPPKLMLKWHLKRDGSHPQVPWQTQAAMARFMSDDLWRSHVRKIRTITHKKREMLVNVLTKRLGDSFELISSMTSLFILVCSVDGRTADDLIRSAETKRLKVYPTMQYWPNDVSDSWNYVLVGFSGISESEIEHAANALADAWLA